MDEFSGLGPYRAIRSYERSDAAATLEDLRLAAFDDAVKVTNFDARASLVEAGYDRVNDRIKSTLGEELDNPYRSGAFQSLIGQHTPWTPEAAIESWNRRIAELRAKAPDALPWDDLVQAPAREAGATMREARARQQEVSVRRGFIEPRDLGAVGSVPLVGSTLALGTNLARDPAGIVNQFAGSLYGQFHSPIDAAANLLSFGAGRAAWSLIRNAVANAMANAGIQAALSLPKQYDYEKAGLPHGWRVWLEEVEGAAATGFVLDLGIRGPARAAVSRYGRDTPAGTLLSRHTERGGLLQSVPEAPAPRVSIDPETYRKAQEGDLSAAREIAEKTGALEDPEVKAAFDTLETVGRLDDEALLELEKMGVARPDGFRVLADAIEGRVPVMPEAPRPAAAPLMREEGNAIVRGRAAEFEALMAEAGPQLAAGHPRLVQFIEDAVEAGVARYVTMVREALDRVHGRRTRAEEARTLVAKIQDIARENPERFAAEIAFQTSPSPIEVAAAIRQFPDLVDSNVRLDSDHMRFARAIAGLEETAFDAAMRGGVPHQIAALVGERVPEAHQARVIDDLAKAAPESLAETKALIDELVPETKTDAVPLDGGAGIDEPTGAMAKAQVEALRQEAGRTYEEAMAPIERRKALESRVETVRGEIARLEQEAAAAAPRYVDPESGLEISRAEVDAIKDMWAYVQDMKAVRSPQSLIDFLRTRGGLRDESNEISAIIDGAPSRPGLIHRNGLSLDDAALTAWEAGFFQNVERPTVAEFLEAVRRDISGNRVTRGIDARAMDDLLAAREMEIELEQLGIAQAATKADIEAHFQPREGRGGAHGREEVAGRTEGEALGIKLDEKRTELAQAEADLAATRSELDARAWQPPLRSMDADLPREPLGSPLDAALRVAVEREISAMLPESIAVRVVDRINGGGELDPYGVFDPSYATVDPLTHIETLGQAVLIAARGSADDMLAIGRHEVIHALREVDLFDEPEWRILVDHAHRHKIDETLEVYDESGQLVPGIPYYERMYRTELEESGLAGADLDRQVAEYLDQERVAWMAEQWHRKETKFSKTVDALLERAMRFLEAIARALNSLGIRSLDDFVANREAARVAESVMSGEIGRRPPKDAAGLRQYALGHDISTGRAMREDLDALGYYSQALRAARAWGQGKGTPEQALAWLKKSGVKDAEIEATGLRAFLEGKASVTREEVVAHLEGNRVGLNEARYGADGASLWDYERALNEVRELRAGRFSFLRRGAIADADARLSAIQQVYIEGRAARYQGFSLDPENPTYRETVLHLPDLRQPVLREGKARVDALRAKYGEDWGSRATRDEIRHAVDEPNNELARLQPLGFHSGHFPEPNTVGHMMTSMTTHRGRPVYTVDQIQSDWGQKLRDELPSDEKIARIKNELSAWQSIREDLQKPASEVGRFEQMPYGYDRPLRADAAEIAPRLIEERLGDDDWGYSNPDDYLQLAPHHIRRLEAELQQAELGGARATPRNPLVNTTDQWVDTTLRRAIRQAAEADAEYIAIPSGRTVLSYNPGDDAGMSAFYDTIVPKNLRNLLRKLDKETPAAERIETLDSPSGKTGLGKGFTLFPLSDAAKRAALDEGQPLFALAGRLRLADRGKSMQDIFRQTGWFRGNDGFWRFEIDDSKAAFKEAAFKGPGDSTDKAPAAKSRGFWSWLTGRDKPAGGAAIKKLMKEMPAWAKGRDIRVARGVPVGEILEHETLFKHYPFLRTMKSSILVGKSIPDDKVGGQISYRRGGNKIIYSGIHVIAHDMDKAMDALLHEVQHYIQLKEGWPAGSAPKPLPKLDPNSDARPRAYSPNTEGGVSRRAGEYDRWRNDRKREERLSWRSEAEDTVRSLRSESDPEVTRIFNNSLRDALHIDSDAYKKDAGEAEANMTADRRRMTAEERRATLPVDPSQRTFDTSKPMTFPEAADVVAEREARIAAMEAEWAKPVEVTDGLRASRVAENDLLFLLEDGTKAFAVQMYPTVGGAEFNITLDGLEALKGRPLAEQKRLAEAAMAHTRKRYNIAVHVEIGMTYGEDFSFWHAIRPDLTIADVRSTFPTLEPHFTKMFGEGTRLEMVDNGTGFYVFKPDGHAIGSWEDGLGEWRHLVPEWSLATERAYERGPAGIDQDVWQARTFADERRLFALRRGEDAGPISGPDAAPEPPIASDMAFIDRLGQIKDLIEACRA